MRKKKLFAVLIALCLMISTLAGCSTSTVSTNKSESVTFTDSAGRQVKLPSKITKIAASGSLAQIVLFALAPDMLVGVSDKWSAESKKYIDSKYYNLPVLGQFYGGKNLNVEEIAKVNPQVVIDVGEAKSTIVEDMNSISSKVNIPTIHIDATTATMPEAYRKLGKLLGREAQGEALAQYCEQTYKKTQDIMNAVGDNGKIKVLYCSGKDGLNALAKGSFHAEILDKVTNNVAVLKKFSSSGSGDPVDMEQITLWNPDVIIFAPGSIYSTVASNPAWQKLNAIKNGKYYEVPNGPYNWMGSPPSVNRYMGMIWITQLLYPEKAQYDVYKETVKYYELFYHCKLTEDQYKALVGNSLLKK
ncbi:MAG: ABC transporter substrate-binding protein [Clostridiaceae bacterium]|nr:ABC transporter substrate-binding protein [Clostridiaceae bacterium]